MVRNVEENDGHAVTQAKGLDGLLLDWGGQRAIISTVKTIVTSKEMSGI